MKYLIALLIATTLLSCGGDDETMSNTLDITIGYTAYHGAGINWTTPTQSTEGSVSYRVVLEGEVLAENYAGNSWDFEQLFSDYEYSGTIFAVDDVGNSTFSNFTFRTLVDTEIAYFSSQADVNNVSTLPSTSYDNISIIGNDIIDLSPLSILTSTNSVHVGSNPQLTNLNGLENLRPRDSDAEINISIKFNSNLTSITGLNTMMAEANNIQLQSNPVLTSLAGVQFGNELSNLEISYCPLSQLPSFGTNTFDIVKLTNVPLSDLSAFRFTPSIHTITLRSMNNLISLDGFDTIESIFRLELFNNDNLSNLNDIETLNSSAGGGEAAGQIAVYIRNNPNLTDFCGLTTWMQNTVVRESCANPPSCTYIVTLYSVINNAYNPTEGQIESSSQCAI